MPGATIRDAIHIQHCWTVAALGANGVYTSDWQMLKLHPIELHLAAWPADIPVFHDRKYIRGHAFSPGVASAVNGLTIDQSLDGVNVMFQTFFTLPAVPGWVAFDVLLISKFVRLTYTNGAAPQVAFALAAWLADPWG